jgi:hypothetical protein
VEVEVAVDEEAVAPARPVAALVRPVAAPAPVPARARQAEAAVSRGRTLATSIVRRRLVRPAEETVPHSCQVGAGRALATDQRSCQVDGPTSATEAGRKSRTCHRPVQTLAGGLAQAVAQAFQLFLPQVRAPRRAPASRTA